MEVYKGNKCNYVPQAFQIKILSVKSKYINKSHLLVPKAFKASVVNYAGNPEGRGCLGTVCQNVFAGCIT